MSAKEVSADYKIALGDLNCNSKPLITMLTMLADENKAHAAEITNVLFQHIKKTVYKLPAMYLIDSIVKNVIGEYKRLIGNSIANIFAGVFKEVDEKTRKKLYELRQTWTEVFPLSRLFHLDTSVREIDPAWPITSQPRISSKPTTIHVNPNKFISPAIPQNVTSVRPSPSSSKIHQVTSALATSSGNQAIEELKRLQTEKRHLEEARKKVEKMMEKESRKIETASKSSKNIYIAPWKVKDLSILPTTGVSPPQKPTSGTPKEREKKVGTPFEKSLMSLDSQLVSDTSKTHLSSKSSSVPSKFTYSSHSKSKEATDSSSGVGDFKKTLLSATQTRDPRLKKTVSDETDGNSSDSSSSKRKDVTKKEKNDSQKAKTKEKVEPLSKKKDSERVDSSKDKDKTRDKIKKDKKKSKDDHDEKSKERSKRRKSRSPEHSSKKTREKSYSKSNPAEISREGKTVETSNGTSKHSKNDSEKKKFVSKNGNSNPDKNNEFSNVHSSSVDEENSKKVDDQTDSLKPSAKAQNIDTQPATKSDSPTEKEAPPVTEKSVSTTVSAEAKQAPASSEERSISDPPLKSNDQPKDVDLRMFTSKPMSETPLQDSESLFGKEDVDLRQLSLHNIYPLPPTQEHNESSKVVEPDTDMRMPVKDNPNLASQLTSEVLASENQLKKSNFSSPHAAKWEKFRENNPEFKEYKRHASISEDGDVEDESLSGRNKLAWRNRLTTGPDFGKNFSEGLHQLTETSLTESPAEVMENYNFMINELDEQRESGGMTDAEYRNCIGAIRMMMEKAKIKEFQELEKSSSNERGNSSSSTHASEDAATESWPLRPMSGQDTRRQNEEMKQRNFTDSPETYKSPLHSNREVERFDYNRTDDFHARLKNQWTDEPELPFLGDEELRQVQQQSETKTIDIDGKPREIRTYGEKAVILLEWDDPRLITFERVECNIVFDEGKFVIPMSVGVGHREFHIGSQVHKIKLGVPTQEIVLNGKGYQCFFGGKPISVYLSGQNRTIRLDGRPPRVNIDSTKDLNYLLGKIELVIDARKIVPLYLDAKPQRFNIDGRPFVIRFTENFKCVTINGMKMNVEFGGLPISIPVRGYRRFLRFSNLPSHVIPGRTFVKEMNRDDSSLLPRYTVSPPLGVVVSHGPSGFDQPMSSSSLLPPFQNRPTFPHNPTTTPGAAGMFNPRMPMRTPLLPNPPLPPILGPTHMPFRPPLGIVPGAYTSTPIENNLPPTTPAPENQRGVVPSGNPLSASVGATSTNNSGIDLHSLLDRLVKTGIISGDASKKEIQKTAEGKETLDTSEEDLDPFTGLAPIDHMFNLDELRKRNKRLISKIYKGMQCSSCGLRYSSDHSQSYSQHLDWHFRMNKKQQDSTKRVSTLKFYHCFDDWIKYQEIEETDDRVPSMFEAEGKPAANESDLDEDSSEAIPSVAVSPDSSLGVCPVCHETFTQFYHHGTEAWHYKYAVQFDGVNYHDSCHQDLVKVRENEEQEIVLVPEISEESAKITPESENLAEDVPKKVEYLPERIEKLPETVEDLPGKVKDFSGKVEDLPEKVEHLPEKVEDTECPTTKEGIPLEHDDQSSNDNKGDTEIEPEVKEQPKKDYQNDVIVSEVLKKSPPEAEEIVIPDDNGERTDVYVHDMEEIKVVDEEIQEIAKVEDLTPKEEIDLTMETDEMEPPAEGSEEDRKLKRQRMLLAHNREVYDPKTVSPLKEVKIKEESIETDEEVKIFICPRPPPLLADVPIKLEVEDVPEPTTIIVDDDKVSECDTELVPTSSWLSSQPSTTAETDIASTIDGNIELETTIPQSTQSASFTPKIRITFSNSSGSALNSLSSTNSENNNTDQSLAERVSMKSINSESDSINGMEDFIPPPFTVNYELKPEFKGVKLRDQSTVLKGIEMSSLCSLM